MGAKVTIIVESNFQLHLYLFWWETKVFFIFIKFSFQNGGGFNPGAMTLLINGLNSRQIQVEMLPLDESTRLGRLKWLI